MDVAYCRRLEKTVSINNSIFVTGGSGVSSTQIFTDQVSESFKLSVINIARSWPFYFSRLFGVNVSKKYTYICLFASINK